MKLRLIIILTVLALVLTGVLSTYGERPGHGTSAATTNSASAVATTAKSPVVGTETIVFFRHGEKPRHGLGQLTPQGLNRAIALSTVLPEKFGRPDFLFAPDPGQKVSDGGVQFNYVRPLMTIEPTAISLEMPVQTPCGFRQIDKLDEDLSDPKYANSMIFVAWEHGYEAEAVANLVAQFGRKKTDVPPWPGGDFDSLYIVKIVRAAGKPPTVKFTHDHEGLNNLSKSMPVPARQISPG